MINKILLMIASVAWCLHANAQTELDNLGIETWTTSDSERYEEPNYPWKTANSGVDFDLFATTNPVTKVTDAYSGDYAAKMESATVFFTFTAGALWTGDLVIDLADLAKSAKFGVPYEGTPTNLKFYYKYFPVNGDSMGVYTILRKWNPATQQQDTIAYAAVQQTETTDEYTQFDLKLEYYIEDVQPDSIEIAFTSSAAGYEYLGQVGSQLFIDEVELFNNVIGIADVLTPEVAIRTFPNPANDHIRFELDKIIPDTQLFIYDSMGRQITTLKLTTNTHQLDISTWNIGTYYFLLKNDNNSNLSSGQFKKF